MRPESKEMWVQTSPVAGYILRVLFDYLAELYPKSWRKEVPKKTSTFPVAQTSYGVTEYKFYPIQFQFNR